VKSYSFFDASNICRPVVSNQFLIEKQFSKILDTAIIVATSMKNLMLVGLIEKKLPVIVFYNVVSTFKHNFLSCEYHQENWLAS